MGVFLTKYSRKCDVFTSDVHCPTCVNDCIGREIEVVFVRHGQSQWNFAQKNWHLWDMARRKDHPLSSEGRSQCEELRYKINQTEFPPVEVIFSSPLARAIETAILVFPDHLRGRVAGKSRRLSLVLLPNAREKLNIGGRDSESSTMGRECVNGAFTELEELYDAIPSDASPVSVASTTFPGSDDDSPLSDCEDTANCDRLSIKSGGRLSIGSSSSAGGFLQKRASILEDKDLCHFVTRDVEENWCKDSVVIRAPP